MSLMKVISCFCCARWSYLDSDSKIGRVRLSSLPDVQLDPNRSGQGVVIVKSGSRICGAGAALANTPIHQNKAYFEAKLQSSGIWGIGLAIQNCNLHKVPLGNDGESWVLRHDGTLFHNGVEKQRLKDIPQEGDIMGFTYDHVEFNVYLNGKPTHSTFSGIKGTVFPVVYVDDGAIIDMNFSRFCHVPPPGFGEIMIEKTLL